MILYHGSYTEIMEPDCWRGSDKLDLGRGFYTTPYREQAAKWAKRFQRRHGSKVISLYEFNEVAAYRELRILEFNKYSEDWLEFITLCRMGTGTNSDYDLIIGSVANDKVFDALEAYFNGFSDKSTAIQRLRYEEPNLHYCFANQETIDGYLRFLSSEVLL